MTLMGKNSCPLCVIIIKENPNLYKAVFPHFLLNKQNFITMSAPNTARLNFCPMLNHLPREDRAKFINKLTSQCKNCLKENPFCYCPNHSPGRCGDCFKSIYICGHEKAEQMIAERKQIYKLTNVAGGGQISSKSFILLLPHEQGDRHKYLECQSANVGSIVSDVTKVDISSLMDDIHNNKEASFNRTNLPDNAGYPTFRPIILFKSETGIVLSEHPFLSRRTQTVSGRRSVN